MRKIYILVAFVMATVSCSKWLDITPENMIIEKDLYKTGTGFQNSLNGIYGDLSKSSLYGKELMYGFVDVLSQNYVIGTYGIGIQKYSYYWDVASFKYTENNSVKMAIDGIWSTGYTTIANCNILLKNLESAETNIFEQGQMEKNLIKGEAIGLRAMLHLDLLRLFGAAPIKGDTKLYIPYVTESPYYGGQAPETVESVMKKIETDMLEARDLIMQYDTLDAVSRTNLGHNYRFDYGQTSAKSVFYSYRGYRLNAIAVNGLLARFYNYWGKHEEAKKYAEEVMDFRPDLRYSTKALQYKSYDLDIDRKCMRDLMFVVSDAYLQENYKSHATLSSNDNFSLNRDMVQFETGLTAYSSDTRFKYLVDKSNPKGYPPLKNIRVESTDRIVTQTEDMIPILRLGEMDLIVAEYYASIGDFVNAERYINNLRAGRECARISLGITDMKSFKENLFIEARKEFFQEGQIFYYYKKYNEPINATMSPEAFIIPTPDSENIN